LIAAWENLNNSLPAGVKPTSEQALNLGRQHGITSGKWLFMAGPRSIDRAWSALANLVCLNAPENLTHAAKVATPSGPKSMVICVYLNNFDDNEAVHRLGNLVVETLKEIFPKGWTSFKPDVYTYLGIYKETLPETGIEPTLHIKRWGP
jgi:hypothetical protein